MQHLSVLLVCGTIALVCASVFMVSCSVESNEHASRSSDSEENASFFENFLEVFEVRLNDCSDLAKWRLDHDDPLSRNAITEAGKWELEYRESICAACLEEPKSVFSDSAFIARRAQFSKGMNYVLRFYPNETAQKRTGEWLDEDIVSQVFSISGSDTIPCAFVHVENLPSNVPFAQVILGFDIEEKYGTYKVLLRDDESVFGSDVLFTFTNDEMQEYRNVTTMGSRHEHS